MKLKLSSVPTDTTATADPFRLDAVSSASNAPAAPSKAAATTVFVFGLIALCIMVAITGMMYVNWSLISPQ